MHPTIFTSHVREFVGGIYVVKKKGSIIFADYPDAVNVEQMCSMLGALGKRQHMIFRGTGTSDISNWESLSKFQKCVLSNT